MLLALTRGWCPLTCLVPAETGRRAALRRHAPPARAKAASPRTPPSCRSWCRCSANPPWCRACDRLARSDLAARPDRHSARGRGKRHATRDALERQALPGWVRVIPVPDAQLRTKPRALNYAMLFARGTVVGVYDAEDAPDPDQIHRVVACFHRGPPTLACVQGVLDFYNPRTNWLARCFTIEYASWFRVILPGMQRLGLAVPLGGTTLFFRRDILDRLGGWDAHNVTEDADLGIRLARHGYYTQLLDTVTQEEANCHVLPWIKQRSRWLKGYAVTWLVHMRPRARCGASWGRGALPACRCCSWARWCSSCSRRCCGASGLMLLGTGHPLQDTVPAGVLPAACGAVPGWPRRRPSGPWRAGAARPPPCRAVAVAAGAAPVFSAGCRRRLQGAVGTGAHALLLGQDRAWPLWRGP